jgi:hypothetical protein
MLATVRIHTAIKHRTAIEDECMKDIGSDIGSIVEKEAAQNSVATETKGGTSTKYSHSYRDDEYFFKTLGSPAHLNGQAKPTYEHYKQIVHEIPRLKMAAGSEIKSFIATTYFLSAALGASLLSYDASSDSKYAIFATLGAVSLVLAGTCAAIGAYRAKKHYNMIKKEVKEKKDLIKTIRTLAKTQTSASYN